MRNTYGVLGKTMKKKMRELLLLHEGIANKKDRNETTLIYIIYIATICKI